MQTSASEDLKRRIFLRISRVGPSNAAQISIDIGFYLGNNDDKDNLFFDTLDELEEMKLIGHRDFPHTYTEILPYTSRIYFVKAPSFSELVPRPVRNAYARIRQRFN